MSWIDILYDNVLISEYGLRPVERPAIPTPELREEFIRVQGRHGSLVIPDAYDDITITIQYNILEDYNIKQLFREIKGFLSNKKKIQFSDDDIFYKIKSIKIQEMENEFEQYGVLTIDHICDPFQYLADISYIQVNTETEIKNIGTVESKPLYRVIGTGEGELNIGENKIQMINMSGVIILDAELLNAYEEGTNFNRNNNVRGVIPGIKKEGAKVTFSGGITSLEINGRWRYL